MIKFIFDIDGTLTPSRKQIDSGFQAFMIKFCCKHDVYLVTGSNREKTVDQIGLDICYRAQRVYNCAGNDVYEKDKNVYRSDWELPDDAKEFLLEELKQSLFAVRTGTHIEKRPGCVNFSILGRGANWTEREVYKEWDHDNHERIEIAKRFNKAFPDLYAFVGGETGVDISLKGNDKGQIIRDFDLNDEIHFFGDRMDENGNDYPLAFALQEMVGSTHYVKGWEDTRTRLEEYSESGEFFK